jgi:A/G-specific adenine glycosylase
MPWRETNDPYKIWISEIMLQQTRVDQAWPFFERFINEFPTVCDLAVADQHQVMKVWEGLGYYSRARNLHAAAKMIVSDYDGKLPKDYHEIIKLKGIGPYTAAAITSIAYAKPHAVVDGNVIRVITRYFGIEEDVRSVKTTKLVQAHVDELISHTFPADFNQGMMELGATVCMPKNPDCNNCPISFDCTAISLAKTDVIPYKSAVKKKPHKHIGVGIIKREDGKVLIALRPENVMLGGLWEFPGGKQEEGESIQQTVERELFEELGVEVKAFKEFMKFKHIYSHFSITMHAFLCRLISGEPSPKSSPEIRWVEISELEQYAFPKANKQLTEKLMGIGQGDLGL